MSRFDAEQAASGDMGVGRDAKAASGDDSLRSMREAHAEHQQYHEHYGRRVADLERDIADKHAHLLGAHSDYEGNIDRLRRHWQTAKHYSTLTGVMAAMVVAKILWATAVNLGEDNLDRDLAGVLSAVSGFAGGMFLLAAYIHYKKGLNVRDELLGENPTLVRSTFNGSTYYPLQNVEESRVDAVVHEPLMSGFVTVAANPKIFVSVDNKAWINARSPANRNVTALLMGLLGATTGAGGCIAFTGAYNIAKMGENHGSAQGMLFMLGFTLVAMGAIMHCASVSRWQRLPDSLGGTPSDELLRAAEAESLPVPR